MRQKRPPQLLPFEPRFFHIHILVALIFDIDGKCIAVFEVEGGAVHGRARAYSGEPGATG